MRMRRTTPASAVALFAAAWLGACTEPTTPGAAAAISWMNEAGVPLASVTPTESRADLAAFTTITGTARIIGLGEATHGSHEFFTMKDRLFRHLVQDAGVTAFAIEATMRAFSSAASRSRRVYKKSCSRRTFAIVRSAGRSPTPQIPQFRGPPPSSNS